MKVGSISSVRFVGLFARLKLEGLSPAKKLCKSPAKKNYPNSDSHIPPSSLQGFLPGHIMIEMSSITSE